jgi:glutamate synthase domain-containing protein 3
MTGGIVVILGKTGRNLAGMRGGVVLCFDEKTIRKWFMYMKW